MSKPAGVTIFLGERTQVAWLECGHGRETGPNGRNDENAANDENAGNVANDMERRDIRLADVVATTETPIEWAGEIARLLTENGTTDAVVVLAIASNACLPVALPADSEACGQGHQALAYAIEPLLPLAAEDVTVAPVGKSGASLFIAAVTARLQPFVDALEKEGVAVQTVCPAALLAVQTFLAADVGKSPCVVLWQVDDRIECFSAVDGNVCRWLHMPASAAAITHNLGLLALLQREPLNIVAIELASELLKRIEQIPGAGIASQQRCHFAEAAAAAVGEIAEGRTLPLADLRTGPLAPSDPYRLIRGTLRIAMSAAALLLVASMVALLARAHRYSALAESYYREQEAVFHDALPGQAAPSGITSRLRSELNKLAVATGDVPSSPQTAASALEFMRRFLAALPPDVPCRISDIRFDGGKLNLDGETLSHAGADKLAACLRQQGFDVEPPRSQQRPDQTIGVHWSAAAVASTPSAGRTHR
ncbi:MAG TPA: GspL/Epsl periplasmic domain-containing protein [Pirellulales bacterium]|nr:GspL/Epsl periplasmic domain-containing protein [Pirellulales bacterium]